MRYLQLTLDKTPGKRFGIRKCYQSLADISNAGLLEDKEVFKADISDTYTINDALRDAREKIKGQSYPAVLAMEYENNPDGTQPVGHCVAMMPDGKYIDVKERRFWKPTLDVGISRIHVVNVKKISIVDWQRNCGLHKCQHDCIVYSNECLSDLNEIN